MKENWEIHWEDYYEILGVSPQSTPDEIKKAWIDKSWILSTDRMKGAPETAKKKAEEELKKVNNSYDILKDTEKRKQYHDAYLQKTGNGGSYGAPPPPRSSYTPTPLKPKPEVNPSILRFQDLVPGEVRRGNFIVKNSGGSFSKILLSDSTWIKYVRQKPLTADGKLPMLVEIEVKGDEWGALYLGDIIVKLDDIEAHVRVELQTKAKPILDNEFPAQICPHCQKQSLVFSETNSKTFCTNIECNYYGLPIDFETPINSKQTETNKQNATKKTIPFYTPSDIKPIGTTILGFLSMLGGLYALIFGIYELFNKYANHLFCFTPFIMSLWLFVIYIIDNNKGGKRGNLSLIWITNILSILAIIFLKEVRWFFVLFTIIITMIIIFRYANKESKTKINQ